MNTMALDMDMRELTFDEMESISGAVKDAGGVVWGACAVVVGAVTLVAAVAGAVGSGGTLSGPATYFAAAGAMGMVAGGLKIGESW